MYDDINSSDVRMLQRTEDRKQDDDVVTFNAWKDAKKAYLPFHLFLWRGKKSEERKMKMFRKGSRRWLFVRYAYIYVRYISF